MAHAYGKISGSGRHGISERSDVEESEEEQFKPPYLPFATFWSFIGQLAERPLPPRIDRSIMAGRSGTDQAGLFSALRSFDLIDDENRVQPFLVELTGADVEKRKLILSAMVRQAYPGPMAVSEANGTELQLTEAFRNDYGAMGTETRRKAVTFFLHALREAGLPTSANFPATRAGSGAPGVPRRQASSRKSKLAKPRSTTTPATASAAESSRTGDSYAVNLVSGGRVSIEVTVNLFQLSREDRDFVISLIDSLKEYKAAHPDPTEQPAQ